MGSNLVGSNLVGIEVHTCMEGKVEGSTNEL